MGERRGGGGGGKGTVNYDKSSCLIVEAWCGVTQDPRFMGFEAYPYRCIDEYWATHCWEY